MNKSLTQFFAQLNTHTVGGIGLGTGLVSILAIVLQHPADSFLSAHGGGSVTPIVDYYANTLALPVLSTAIGAAYFGRPKSVQGAK